MKNFKKLLLSVLAVSFLLLSSCKKDSSDVTISTTFTFTTGGTVQHDFSALVSGESFMGSYYIDGYVNDTTNATIVIPSLAVGKYTLASNKLAASVFVKLGKDLTYASDYGTNATYTIEITSIADGYVEGTFSGKLGTSATELGTESKYIDVTNGKFVFQQITTAAK
jgi:hypothetical protein